MFRSLLAGLVCLGIPIVGGKDADQPYGFMVSLQQFDGEHFCGGSLIKPEWVVTAAHCVRNNPAAEMKARVGSNDRTRGGEQTPIIKVVVHPGYDLALVKLAVPARSAPIPIAAKATAGIKTRLLGWGQTCPQPGECEAPPILQQMDTQVLEFGRCLGIDSLLELCTDSPGGTAGACYGDSGGPQITQVDGKWQLVGVTSRAGNDSSACASGPSIYTNVIAFMEWINQQTG